MNKEKEKKLLGEDRREWILNYLKNSSGPVTGTALAEKSNVSRQVIVGDITLLKARNEPIIATSQGYLYMRIGNQGLAERIIACRHDRSQAEQELNIIVDHGVTVKDVTVEHPVYGDLTASIMVSNRKDVQAFLKSIRKTNASLLLELTSGLHLHTLTAPDEQMILNAEKALHEAGILAEEN
ncbi:transcription repressor NadR [Siminovitchia fortis]|uniref:Transcription repressor NadR n=1 Tax=Siminovitchia fortis TaxID=254758 RepID=A0A443ITX5_9BACI|nr:transcription repressor NadR [Siminovitchia fortis]RWR11158.1 transcription repressor NadR [Siminovitchia fortis]WHY82513.1 transcription repressor NadR [Siminovitchia fortis]